MGDSAVNNKSNSADDDKLSCSTRPLTQINNVLINTSNLHDKSKPLDKVGSPAQQIEHMEGVEHESPVQQNIEGVGQESPAQQNMEVVEQESPEQQNKELIEQKSPKQQNKEDAEQESPVQQSMESVDQNSPTSSTEKKNDFEIGDIVWAKIGRYPFWPSIVCMDPETNVYIKGSLRK